MIKKNVDSKEIFEYLNKKFNPNGAFSEALIPLSYLLSEEGKDVILGLYNREVDKELSIAFVADQLGVTKSNIYYLIKQKRLNGYKKNGVMVIKKSELDRYKKEK